MDNRFNEFSNLPETLQLEAIREGEMLLQAQLAAASAADQRALTWSGFLITGATGALGGGIALISQKVPDFILASLAFIFAIFILRGAWLALETAKPASFYFPGNCPDSWLPSQWESTGTERIAICRARREQAENLHDCIMNNRQKAHQNGEKMSKSFLITVRTILLIGSFLIIVMIYRYIKISEPGSDVHIRADCTSYQAPADCA